MISPLVLFPSPEVYNTLQSAKAFPIQESGTRAQPLPPAIFISLVALAIATYFALTVDLFSWDVAITQWVQGFSLGPAKFLMGWLFWMGIRGVAGAVLVLLFGVFWLRNLRIEAMFLGLIGIPDLFNIWLREIIGRPRPTPNLVDVVIGYGGIQGYSFPSGHSLHVFLFYGFLLYLATRLVSSQRLLYALCTIGTLHILASGVWLIYYGRHWFTDVMGGYIYGAFYLLVLIAAYRWIRSWLLGKDSFELSRWFPRLLRKPAEYVLRLII